MLPLPKLLLFVYQLTYCYFYFKTPLREVISPLYSSIVVKNCMMTFARSVIKEKAFLLCNVLISASRFPIFMILFINIVVLMTMLGHRKYQYLFRRENQGKIICPHACLVSFCFVSPLKAATCNMYIARNISNLFFHFLHVSLQENSVGRAQGKHKRSPVQITNSVARHQVK